MRDSRPKVSIGIPAYNEELNIGRLLSSILSQEQIGYKIQEIIVITDGCTDNTENEITELIDDRIKLVVGEKREGQAQRQNEIVSMMSPDSDYLLLLEADTLPKDRHYISDLIAEVPENNKFSMVVGTDVPIPAKKYFEQVMDFAYRFKRDLCESALDHPNLYLCNGQSGRLFSQEFLKQMNWENDLQEDSYCYRKAIFSDLPIIKCDKATIYFKLVDNLKDYLTQSGKFQKARERENRFSDIYQIRISPISKFEISFKYFLSEPVKGSLYLLFFLISRIYIRFLPGFTDKWRTYYSSKELAR